MTDSTPFDVSALNNAMIEAEDIVFGMTKDNVAETAKKLVIHLGVMKNEVSSWITNGRAELGVVQSIFGDLAEIHKIISAFPKIMNNLIVNTTLQALKLSYYVSINEETHFLPYLEKTHSVIRTILEMLGGSDLDTVTNIADIIEHTPTNKTESMAFLFDDVPVVEAPKQTLKILIVDDESVHRTLMRKIVEPYGACDIATNGQTALLLFEEAHDVQAPYDLITLDIMMPIMDGQQTLKMIRRREREMGIPLTQEVTIFMASSMDGDHVLEAFFRGHCTDYIKKPFSAETILSKMQSNRLIP